MKTEIQDEIKQMRIKKLQKQIRELPNSFDVENWEEELYDLIHGNLEGFVKTSRVCSGIPIHSVSGPMTVGVKFVSVDYVTLYKPRCILWSEKPATCMENKEHLKELNKDTVYF